MLIFWLDTSKKQALWHGYCNIIILYRVLWKKKKKKKRKKNEYLTFHIQCNNFCCLLMVSVAGWLAGWLLWECRIWLSCDSWNKESE